MSLESPLSVHVDMDELRGPVLNTLCKLSIVVGWLWFTVIGATQTELPPFSMIIPGLILALTAAVVLLGGTTPIRSRRIMLLTGLGSSYLLALWHSPSVIWICCQCVIVGISGLLFSASTSFLLTSLLTISSALVLYGQGRLSTEYLWPYALVWGTAMTSWVSSQNLYTALRWALDSQSTAWETAREVQERRAELRRALHSLTTAYDTLNRTSHELDQARAEAEQARKVKSQFVARISHELRTPLNIIVGFSEMLCTSPETYDSADWSPALREDLLTIWRNSEHLLSMIDDVLDLAQIDAERLPISREPTEVVGLVRDTLSTATALFRDTNLELRVIMPEQKCVVNLDSTRIRQVILNLVNNAVRYTVKGRVEVSLDIDTDRVIICVRDTGVGIAHDKLDLIFEEFEQVPTAERRSGGIGLGLAISKHFVRLHGGEIWVESAKGQGSAFFFSIPLSPATPVIPEGLRRTERSVTDTHPENKRTIALLSHDPRVSRMLERHGEGFVVHTAEDGDALQSCIEVDHPSIVVIQDDMDGCDKQSGSPQHEILKSLERFDVPVIFCAFQTESAQGALPLANGSLFKPVGRDDLTAAIAELVSDPRKALVIDDDHDMVRLLGRYLKRRWPKVQVITAYSGEEALALAAHGPDIILLDLVLPGITGAECLAVLRADKDTAHIPVITITASGLSGDQRNHTRASLRITRPRAFTSAEIVRALAAITSALPPVYANYTRR